MSKKKKQRSEAPTSNREKHYKKALSYEDDIFYIYKKSARRAWTIAFIFGFISVVAFACIAFLFPLKETTPYLIREDSNTGIPYIVTAIDPQTFEADEMLDRYFVNYYINLRQGYTWQTIQKTYTLTQLFSSANVASAYRAEYDKDDSLDNVLKKGTATVKVISISLEEFSKENLATARIEVNYTNTNGEALPKKHYLVKMTYEYQPKKKLTLSYRIENPLGFTVTSYQAIEEAL